MDGQPEENAKRIRNHFVFDRPGELLSVLQELQLPVEMVRKIVSALDGQPRAMEPAAQHPPRDSADRLFLERVEAIIREGLSDENFDVRLLAKRVATARCHLYRRLHNVAGCSPGKLIMERRLNRASDLLAQRQGGVTDIAYAVGFKSVAHFSRAFRARYGTTPSAYFREHTRAPLPIVQIQE